MKLLRYRTAGAIELGVLDGDRVVSLAPLSGEFPTMLSIIGTGEPALERIAAFLETADAGRPLGDVELLCPIERPGKYLAIGMNYGRHLEEALRHGISAPAQQFWFNKQTTCLSGPYDPILPGVTEKLDYEVELGVVIGKAAKSVAEADARDHVFGYLVANDVSARDWQFHSPTFTVGKSFDTHGPIGPWIVTADEIEDPHNLRIRCWVNGEVRQDSNTSDLIYDIWAQIAYLSAAFTLEPGDLLATGTPEGVGIAMNPPRFLTKGDVVRCEAEGIGFIENVVG
jgi:2-keto-4-pentenoate hydratase/2-oxohepta-3-ene-1,7-dioic acid hydratase in catechol pathway